MTIARINLELVTPEVEEWCSAESAHNCTASARKELGRAVLALDSALADDEADSSPDRRDLETALRAVRSARSLLRVARGALRPLVKAAAGRKDGARLRRSGGIQ